MAISLFLSQSDYNLGEQLMRLHKCEEKGALKLLQQLPGINIFVGTALAAKSAAKAVPTTCPSYTV